jgi:hypothetical protein
LFSARLREDIHSEGEPLYHALTSAWLYGLSVERLDEVVKQSAFAMSPQAANSLLQRAATFDAAYQLEPNSHPIVIQAELTLAR